jgi:DNA modification methylase
MAKTIEDLTKSREARQRILDEFGGELPESIMKRGDWVVDPFAGHNSRMELCWRAGRNYKGNDISAEFQAANERIKAKLLAEAGSDIFSDHFNADIELTTGDSRHLPWENGSGDFTITSPPYYNLEHYGDEPGQLGIGARSYNDFLDRLQKVCCENFRVLKQGRFAVWCVNDFRANGKFHSYHSHVIRLMEKAGFNQYDIAIVDLGHAMRISFPAQAVEQQILPKRHEYALVFQKPI